jgi:hypothetical protein
MSANDVLAKYLAGMESRYDGDAKMTTDVIGGIGYHTALQPGTPVHSTRDTLRYGHQLLMSDSREHRARAHEVIHKVVSLQDTDSDSATYGIWSWYLEEPLEDMRPPDWNWADFLGATLATILARIPERVAASLAAAMRASLGHAAAAIVRRDVGPGYTNIAIMGGGVTAAAGELLADDALLVYGRERLRKSVEHANYHGSFNEFNSPTYTFVALAELERPLAIVRDLQTRAHAEALRRFAWESIAAYYHPATAQFAGPQSRAYADWLPESTVAKLVKGTGLALPFRTGGGALDAPAPHAGEPPLFPSLPCPEDMRPRFEALPETPHERHQTFIREKDAERSTTGVTWFDHDACLGSMNRGYFWVQRRVLLGYWQTDEDAAVCLRLRFLHDGRDFASATVENAQAGPAVLTRFGTRPDGGDWHGHLDRPEDGVFHAESFRARYQLQGVGVSAHQLNDATFALRAGHREALVHALPGVFFDHDVRWECGQSGDVAYVDAVCYEGVRAAFDYQNPGATRVGAGLHLRRVDDNGHVARPSARDDDDGRISLGWPAHGLTIE